MEKETIEKLKACLHVPYLDSTEELAFTTQAENCAADLCELCGDQDFSSGLAFDLLCNRLLYLRSDALDDFEKNYRAEILRLQMRSSAYA